MNHLHNAFIAKDDALVIKDLRKAAREVDFVASTETVDSHGDVIDQASWNLRDFLANPIVLYSHDNRSLPIGKSVYTAVKNNVLECTLKITDKIQLARDVWDLLCEEILRAVSVGFRPVNGGYEMRGGEDVWVWKNPILKEISIVPIGSNPEALAKTKALFLSNNGDRAKALDVALRAGLIETEEKDAWIRLPESTFGVLLSKRHPKRVPTAAPPSPSTPSPDELRAHIKAKIGAGVTAMNALGKSVATQSASEAEGVLAAQAAERERLAENRKRKAKGERTPREIAEAKARAAFDSVAKDAKSDGLGPAAHLHPNHDPLAALEQKRAEVERHRNERSPANPAIDAMSKLGKAG